MKWLTKLVVFRRVFDALSGSIIWLWNGFANQVLRCLRSLRVGWCRLPPFRRHFTTNFVIGVVIAVLLHFVHHSSLVAFFENFAADSMMVLNQGLPRMASGTTNNAPLRFTFLDIDEDSYRTWDEPFHTPRGKLLRLIRFAATGGARAVIVDVKLAKASDDDAALLAFLSSYDESYPPLILVKGFYPESPKHTNNKDYMIRPSILDGLEVAKNIHWAQPLFKLSTYDQSVRYWQLVAIGCLNDRPVVLPAIQLWVDMQLSDPDNILETQKQLQSLAPKSCSEITQTMHGLSGELVYADKRIELDYDTHQRVGERIIYTLPPVQASTEEVLRRPAYKITETDKRLSDSAVKDRIVVIGASYADTRDLYRTPLGRMPGAMVVINAIKSLHLYGQTKPPSSSFKLLIELCLITLMSWVFARFFSRLAATVITVAILAILVPISFYFFKYGVWVDLAIPLLAMLIHKWVAQYEEKRAIQHRSEGAAPGQPPRNTQ